MDRHHVCGISGCQRRFKTLYNVNRHRDRHKESGKYKCEKCDKTFIEMSSLSNHRRRHTYSQTYPPISCDICDKIFTRTSYMLQHRKIHDLQDSKIVTL